jgi:uncharacterized protein (TIGR02598 family)
MKRRSNCAFSLVEVTLALGIAAFCLIAIFGLMPVGVQTNRNATSQTAATSILSNVIADIRTTAKVTPSATPSPLYKITVPARGNWNSTAQTLYLDGQGQAATSLSPASPTPFQPRYQLNVTFPPNPDVGTFKTTYSDLKITWPAAATPANASGSVEIFAAFDRN